MEIEFKYALEGDLPKIVATYNSTISSRLVTADLEPVDVSTKRAWFEAHSPQKRPLWIISCDNNYAGWMSFNSFYGRPAYDGTVEVSIYLDSEYRGTGLGKACLKMALEVAPTLDISNLLGFIFAHNTISLNLFYQFGFKKWGHLPEVADMDGVLRDLIIVGKKMDAC